MLTHTWTHTWAHISLRLLVFLGVTAPPALISSSLGNTAPPALHVKHCKGATLPKTRPAQESAVLHPIGITNRH
jgi:hypothetical protein